MVRPPALFDPIQTSFQRSALECSWALCAPWRRAPKNRSHAERRSEMSELSKMKFCHLEICLSTGSH